MSEHNHVSFYCSQCSYEDTEVSFPAETAAINRLITHLKEAHGLQDEDTKRTRRRVLVHMDADKWSQWDYLITLDDQPLFAKAVRHARRPGATRFS